MAKSPLFLFQIWIIRITGLAIIVTSFYYLYWLLLNLNTDALYVSIPFLIALLIAQSNTFLSIINNWNMEIPSLKLLEKNEPLVGVIIPTLGEPVEMVMNTARSVLEQNWNPKKLIVVISDDGHNKLMQLATAELSKKYSSIVLYNLPPKRGDPARIGEAKAGNLNSGLALLNKKYPQIEFIETRDADDLVGDVNFLRYTMARFQEQSDLSFVQTIKENLTSPSDPFGNQEALFYRQIMFTKHATNSVFPCGSGLVWRKTELTRIGGFPAWNLVEDLQSGYEILQKLGKGDYLPIVGALSQAPVEDIPNFYKQRGTWALDTTRLMIWRNPIFKKNLTFFQKTQFLELATFYFVGISTLIFILTIILGLTTGIYAVENNDPYTNTVVMINLFTLEIFIFVRAYFISFESLWRSRQMWIGLSPVYAKAIILALIYGPHKKPVYKVTRKYTEVHWYFKEVLVQKMLLLALVIATGYHLWTNRLTLDYHFATLGIGLFYIMTLQQIIRDSWFGINVPKVLLEKVTKIFYSKNSNDYLFLPPKTKSV